MSELKPHHFPIPEPRKFVKEIADRPLQFELMGAVDGGVSACFAHSRDVDDPDIRDKNLCSLQSPP